MRNNGYVTVCIQHTFRGVCTVLQRTCKGVHSQAVVETSICYAHLYMYTNTNSIMV